MEHDRTSTIQLSAAVARCEPSACVSQVKAKCARYQASIPKHGSLGDFSLVHPGGTALCEKFIGSSGVRVAAAPLRPAKPYTKGL